MIIKYLNDGIPLYQESSEVLTVPSIGNKIFLDEIYFVKDVVYYLVEKVVVVHLDDREKTASVTETTVINANNANEISKISSIANRALKETSELKRQISTVRQQLRTQQSPRKNQHDI